MSNHIVLWQKVTMDAVRALIDKKDKWDGYPVIARTPLEDWDNEFAIDAIEALDVGLSQSGLFGDGRWFCEAYYRQTTVPFYDIRHMHKGPRGGENFESVEVRNGILKCYKCDSPVPKQVMSMLAGLIVEHQPGWFRGQGFKEGSAATVRLKPLTHDWYLDQRKRTKYRMLVHHCAPNHPAGICFSRGIPLHMIDLPPFPGECKTCRQQIPGGVKIAINLHTRRFK